MGVISKNKYSNVYALAWLGQLSGRANYIAYCLYIRVVVRKDLLGTISSGSQYIFSNIKTFDFSTLYTTISHTLLTSRIKELIQRCFSKKNGEQRYQYLVIGRNKSYFVKIIQNLLIILTWPLSFALLTNERVIRSV